MHTTTQQPGQEALGKAGPVPQRRAGGGQGLGQRAKGQLTGPSWADHSRPSPPPASSDFSCLSCLAGSFWLLVFNEYTLAFSSPCCWIWKPCLGASTWDPTVLLPSYLLRSDSGLGTRVPSGLPLGHMEGWCLLLRANTALCQAPRGAS